MLWKYLTKENRVECFEHSHVLDTFQEAPIVSESVENVIKP